MMNGLGRLSSGTGVVCHGEEKREGVLEGSRRNVKENMQNSVDLPPILDTGSPWQKSQPPTLATIALLQ